MTKNDKRSVADTSFDDLRDQGSSKSAKLEDEQPAWVDALMKKLDKNQEAMEAKMDTLIKSINAMEERVDTNKIRLEQTEIETGRNTFALKEVQEEMAAMKLENETLRGNFDKLQGNYDRLEGKYDKLRADLDKQIDNDMRENIVIYGLPQKPEEKSWDDTIARLTKWLAEHTEKTADYFDKAIFRCHRGPGSVNKSGPKPIFCKMNFRVAEELRALLRYKTTDGVTLKDQFSDNTQERINQALIYRKSYVKYPAELRCQKATEKSYSREKVF